MSDKPYSHFRLPWRKRVLLALVDALESAWAFAHSPTGDGLIGVTLIGIGVLIGVGLMGLLR